MPTYFFLYRKVVFDDEGDVVDDSFTHKLSVKGKSYENEESKLGGLDIVRARAVLRAEDVFDRKVDKQRVKTMHKEQKRKAKEASSKRKKSTDKDEAVRNAVIGHVGC